MLPDVREETHIEHLVGLVEDQDLQVGQVDCSLADMVEQPPRAGHDDVDRLFSACRSAGCCSPRRKW